MANHPNRNRSQMWQVSWYSRRLESENLDWDETLEGPELFHAVEYFATEQEAREFAARIARTDLADGEDPPEVEPVTD